MENTKQFISINRDMSIEIQYNPNISNKPYLLKTIGYEGYSEYRLDMNDMLSLAESIADFAFDKAIQTGYNDIHMGLYRLLQHRYNQALDKIEELQQKTENK